MIPALVFTLFAHAVAPAWEEAAARFTQALTSSEIRTLLPLATKQELSGDGWASVREFFERWDCVSIRSARLHDEGEWLVVDIDGDGITRNAKHERRPISGIWYLKLGANGPPHVGQPLRLSAQAESLSLSGQAESLSY